MSFLKSAFALFLCLTFLSLPSSARIREIPYTDRELAERGARLYGMVFEISRKDADVTAAVFGRMAARVWAYQTLVELIDGKAAKKIAPPPNPDGWRQLMMLLLQANRCEEGLDILSVDPPFEEPERLLLDILFLNGTDRRADRPATRLLEILKQNPLIPPRLARRWRVDFWPPFRDAYFEIPLEPRDDVQTEIVSILESAVKELRPSRDQRGDTWALVTPEAAPGQEILIEGAGPVEPNWKRAEFIQYGKTFTSKHQRNSGVRNKREGLYRGTAVIGVPDEMMQGSAKFVIPKVGQFDLKITSTPAPARIQSLDPDRVIPGDWVRIDCVGLQASRPQDLYTADKDQSKFKEWPVTAVFSQGGQKWTVERTVQIWRGWIHGDLVFRAPWALSRGNAKVELKLMDAVSESYQFTVCDWPDMENFERSDREQALVGMPGSTLTTTFSRAADAYAGIVQPPSGRYKIWRPSARTQEPTRQAGASRERPAAQPDALQFPAELKWHIPEDDWEIGVHDVVWAARIGGMWSIANLFGETLTVSPFAPAPEHLDAIFIRNAEGTTQTFGANGYETLKYGKGDILISGQAIETGETYDISVRFNFGNVYSTRMVSTYDWIAIVHVSPTGPLPEFVEVRRVIGGIPGMPANIPVRDYGGVMGDLFTAQTPEGQAAVEWLMEVRSKLRSARFDDQPSVKQMLSTLMLDTFPVSPWGGQWTYVRTPGHPSLTFMAHDYQGILKAQFYSGGIGAGLMEYDLLTRGETYGIVRDNLYWTYPWATNGLGNMVCDAMLDAARADVAVHNTLGLRGNLPAGPVSRQLIQHILPFDNSLIVLHMKGSDLRDLLKEAYVRGRFLYPAGMNYEVDSTSQGVEVTISMGIGKSFSPTAMYRVAMPSYLAEKVAGYPKTQSATDRDEDGSTVREAVEEYIRKKSPLPADRTPRVIERIH